MPAYTWYKTPVNASGTATAASTEITVWFGTMPYPSPPPTYNLYINDANGDGVIEAQEFQSSVGGTIGLNGGTADRLFLGKPGGSGTVFTSYPVTSGTTGLTSGLDNNFASVPPTLAPPPPCFARGTRIKVPGGWRVVENLDPGDLVCLHGGGRARLCWVGHAHLPAARVAREPRLWPVRIARGAFGPAFPKRDLLLSPQHRVLLRSTMADLLLGESEVLMPAHRLVGLPGVTQERPRGAVDYFHLALDRHEILNAEGLPAESLYLGRSAREALGAAAWDELSALFPELSRPAPDPRPARVLAEGPSAAVIAGALPQDGRAWV